MTKLGYESKKDRHVVAAMVWMSLIALVTWADWWWATILLIVFGGFLMDEAMGGKDEF